MRSQILCRERLNRVLEILDRQEGALTARDFLRRFAVRDWELKQAEELGWIRIIERKPRVGRPSLVVEKLSEIQSAKLPPYRYAVPPEIRYRHQRFASETVNSMSGGVLGLKMATAVHAYLKVFPHVRSRSGAYASASRLMKRRDVTIVRLWFRKTLGLRSREPMPATVDGIIQRLKELGLI